MTKTFGTMIYEARKRKKMTLRDVSAASKISISHICNVERHRVRPTRDFSRYAGLIKMLGIDRDEAYRVFMIEKNIPANTRLWKLWAHAPAVMEKFFEDLHNTGLHEMAIRIQHLNELRIEPTW